MSTDQDVSEMQKALKMALRAHWRLFLFQGVVMIILGGLAVAEPFVATIAVDIYVGWLFLISGIVGLIAMFSARDVPAFLWTLLTAALSLAVGVMLIWKPIEGAVSLTIVLTALFIAEGIFQIVASFTYRDVVPGSWGWMLASGIADLNSCGDHRLQLAGKRRLVPGSARRGQLAHLRHCRCCCGHRGSQRRALSGARSHIGPAAKARTI